MLEEHRKGYAVMNPELTALSIEGDSIKHLSDYCYNGDVIAERIPVLCGFIIGISLYEFYKLVNLKGNIKSILWLHWNIRKKYRHKTGKVVFVNPNQYPVKGDKID